MSMTAYDTTRYGPISGVDNSTDPLGTVDIGERRPANFTMHIDDKSPFRVHSHRQSPILDFTPTRWAPDRLGGHVQGFDRPSRRAATIGIVAVVGVAVTGVVLASSPDSPRSAPPSADASASPTPSSTPGTTKAPGNNSNTSTEASASRTATLCSLQSLNVAALVRDQITGKKLSFEAMRDAVELLDEQIDGLSIVLPASPASTKFTRDLNAVGQAWRDALTAYDEGHGRRARGRAAAANRSIAALDGDLAALNATCAR